jgi:hypothetical protein
MFAIAPLDWIEWKAVLLLSVPVVFIDEVLKLLTVRLLRPLTLSSYIISHAGHVADDFHFSTNQGQNGLSYQ